MTNETPQNHAESSQTTLDPQTMSDAQRINYLEQRVADLEALLVRDNAVGAESQSLAAAPHSKPSEPQGALLIEDDAASPETGGVFLDDLPPSPRATRRRALLKTAGIAAAAALAAAGATEIGARGLVIHGSGTGTGANPLYGGLTNTETATTYILSSSGIPATGAVVIVGNTNPGGFGLVAYGGVGGIGLIGNSSGGLDIYAGGSGRIQQTPQSFTGAPTSGAYNAGEQIRDANGDLYICVFGGAPGTWKKVAAGAPGISGATTFLANPIRLLDTRKSSPYTGGSNHSLQVTGVVIGGISVPAGAIGVIGNITVVSPSAGGDLRLYPGPTLPATSSINFATGQVIANGVTVALNSSGQLLIQVDMPSGAHTNVLFDASAYIV